MIQYIIVPLIFSAIYAVKGGSLGYIPGFKKLKESNPVTDFILDGTRLAALLAGAYMFAHVGMSEGAQFALAWFLGTIVSMGEEAGAIGHYRKHWGPYVEWMPEAVRLFKFRGKEYFTRRGVIYGWKKGLQRGVWMGAALTLATGYPGFILAGLTFPFCHFIGQSLWFRLTGKDSWVLAEPLIGFVFGLAALGV